MTIPEDPLDFLREVPDFTDVYTEICVPEMLSTLFSNHIHMNLATDENTMTVDLFIMYVDLLEKVSEETAQQALQLGAGSYFDKVLAFGNRLNLLQEKQNEESHPLV